MKNAVDSDDEEIPEDSAEAPKGSTLGRIAFAPVRTEQVPFEKNTREEDSLLSSLVSHFEKEKKQQITARQIAMIKDFMSRGIYKEIFHETEAEVLYRGMVVTRLSLDKLLGEEVEESEEFVSVEKNLTWKPRRMLSSWTTDDGIAEEFATKNIAGNKTTRVILHARRADNQFKFVACAGGLYDLEPTYIYGIEEEVIALNQIKLFKIEYSTTE
jgi:hypothetical protein